MSETTWTTARTGFSAAAGPRATGIAAAVGALWVRAVVAPLHRALDAGLRAGELRELGPDTLADIGYRRC